MNDNNLETVSSLSSVGSPTLLFNLKNCLSQEIKWAKLLLEPSQPVDIADVIGSLPIAGISISIVKENEAIEVYEYLDPIVQQTLLERLRSGEVLEIVEKCLLMKGSTFWWIACKSCKKIFICS